LKFLKAMLDVVTGLPSMPATGVADEVSEVWRAPPGTGKTKNVKAVVRRLLAADPGASVLVVAPLQELTGETHMAYKDMGFHHYKDQAVRHGGRIVARRLVCCVNSLVNVDWDCFNYVVVDEPNKILADLETMKNSVGVYEKLTGFMREAKKCWVLDGYADSRVEQLMEHAGLGDTAVWTQVLHQNHPGRKATLLFGADLRVAVDKIEADVLSGKRAAVPAASKTNAETMYTALKERLEQHGKTVWLLTGDTEQDRVDFMLACLREGGDLPDVFIYTSKIEVGCSFELPLFHKAVALVSDNLSAKSVMQMIERFRNLIDNEVLLWFDKNITDPDEVRACNDYGSGTISFRASRGYSDESVTVCRLAGTSCPHRRGRRAATQTLWACASPARRRRGRSCASCGRRGTFTSTTAQRTACTESCGSGLRHPTALNAPPDGSRASSHTTPCVWRQNTRTRTSRRTWRTGRSARAAPQWRRTCCWDRRRSATGSCWRACAATT